MSTASKVFREYITDDSFLNLVIPENVIPNNVTQFQVTPVLARDYDGNDSTNGKFIPYWDTEKVTPDVIKKFKDIDPRFKVLVSIGNKNKQFPFTITNIGEWISNATASLKGIIESYHLDGVDVNYEDIEASQPDFVQAIGKTVKNLKEDKVISITVASVTTNVTTDKFYFPLYQKYGTYFDTVVFQSFIDLIPDPTRPIESLEAKILAVAKQYEFVKNFLVGYSALKEDWANISPSIFFITLHDLLHNPKVKGASIKVFSDALASFPAAWITKEMSLAASHAATT